MSIEEDPINESIKNRLLGYNILTISNKKEYKVIGYRKNFFNRKNVIIFYNPRICIVERKYLDVQFFKNNSIYIDGLGKFEIISTDYMLTNPTRRIINLEDTCNRICEETRKIEQHNAILEVENIRRRKNEKIAELEKEIKRLETNFTIKRVERLNNIQRNLITGIVTCYSSSNDSYNDNKYYNGYQNSYVYKETTREQCHDLTFIINCLEELSKRYKCNSFDNNSFSEIQLKIDNLYSELLKEYNEETVNKILSLYGILAEELSERVISLCNTFKNRSIDTSKIKYEKMLCRNALSYYDDDCEYYEIERINNYFNKLIEGACTFIENVTGNDIRSEINKKIEKNNQKIYKKDNK